MALMGNPIKRARKFAEMDEEDDEEILSDKLRFKGSIGDYVSSRYQIQLAIGRGGFSNVFKVLDHKNGSQLALKVIKSSRRLAEQAKLEIHILKLLQGHPESACVEMVDDFTFKSHTCIIFKSYYRDLYSELKSRELMGFEIEDARHMIKCLVSALVLCNKLGIVHADVKPENMMLRNNKTRDIVLIDFGSANFCNRKINTYMQTRFYRSPEIVLGHIFGTAIDMWSTGCVLIEMMTGRPMFPVRNEGELLQAQIKVCGMPPVIMLDKCSRTHKYFYSIKTPENTLEYDLIHKASRIESITSTMDMYSKDVNLIDFIKDCLNIDASKRITPENAIKHCFIQEK